MHYLYLAAVKKDEETKTEEIANLVSSQLEEEGFCNTGFFGSGKADWYVIGGRWSGWLKSIQNDFFKKADEFLKSKQKEKKDFITQDEVNNNQDELQKIWIDLGEYSLNPYNRSSYQTTGYEDDVLLLDEKLLEALKKTDYTDLEVCIFEDGYIDSEVSLDDFLKREDILNNYYICVVDYHN